MGRPGGEATVLWPELEADVMDIYTTKQGHSAFFPGKTTLHEQLQAKGIESVIIAGAVTNVCCEASARDAAELQYKVTMLSDALIGQSPDLDKATLTTFFRCYGDVRPTKNAIELLG
jgi:nicotinamidase-related amidase